MSNPIIYAADMSAAAFTMSLAEVAAYPLSNLHTNLRSLLWKGPDATNAQTLNIDLGSAKACDFLAIGACNFSGMTTVKFQYATTDDGNFTDPVDALTLNGIAACPIALPFTSATKRYWRVLFTNCNSLVPECGHLLLGSKLTMDHSYDWDFNIGDRQYSTSKKIDWYGAIRTARNCGGRPKHRFKLSLTNDAFRTSWQALLEKTFGSANPFFFVDDGGVNHVTHFAEDYLPISKHRYNITDLIEVELIDQLTT